MDALMVDGNAVAGLLHEVFAVEMTTAIGTCGNCGAAEAVGAIHVFRGAGIVLRCPHCDNALVKIVRDGDTRVWISFRGVSTLELAL
jgi:Zn finger protein HypA/HybF involved in hydrogenase expression